MRTTQKARLGELEKKILYAENTGGAKDDEEMTLALQLLAIANEPRLKEIFFKGVAFEDYLAKLAGSNASLDNEGEIFISLLEVYSDEVACACEKITESEAAYFGVNFRNNLGKVKKMILYEK